MEVLRGGILNQRHDALWTNLASVRELERIQQAGVSALTQTP